MKMCKFYILNKTFKSTIGVKNKPLLTLHELHHPSYYPLFLDNHDHNYIISMINSLTTFP